MAATPIYALPYPVPSDPADVPADMQALANRIEAVVGPGTVNGQIPVWDNTNKKWVATPPAPTSPDLAYAENTTAVVVSASGEAGAQTIVTCPAVTFDGATKIEVDFSTPQAGPTVANGTLWFYLFDGGSSIGIAGVFQTGPGGALYAPVFLRRRLTPSAGSHTFSMRASMTGGNAQINGGVGGTGVRMPTTLKVFRV